VKRGAREEAQVPPTTQPVVTTMAPPPPTTLMALPVTGTVSVASTPVGATVTVDGQARGVTPLEIGDLAMGPHEVKLDLKGYVSGEQKFVLSPEAPRSELAIALSRTAPAQGTAEVTSQPSGALVKINGLPAGHTPFMDKLKLGSHAVEVTKDGFEPWSGTIAVKAGRKTAVHAWLKGMVRATPTPVPTFDPNRIHAANEVDTQARKLSGNTASYPDGKAPKLKSGQTVSVTVSFVVNQDGGVSDVAVVESGGAEVDQEVAKAVRGWKYSPAVKNGVKVKSRMTFKQTFRAG
jgi:TonB family protein